MRAFARWLLLAFVVLLVGCKSDKPAPSVAPEPAVSVAPAPAQASSPAPSAAATPSAPVAAPVAASGWARPFLYRIDGPKPSYLLGTIHVPDARLATWPPSVERAFNGADAVYTEIPMDAATQTSLAPSLSLPQGQSWKTLLPAPVYARLEAAIAARGLPVTALATLKLWVIATQLLLLDRLSTFMTMKALDAAIFDRAEAGKKEALGLETPQEQLAIFDGMTNAEQARMVEEALDLLDKAKATKRDMIEELLVAFLKGDADKVRAAMTESFNPANPVDVKLMKRVLTDRNASMTERIAAKVKASPGKSFLFAVGAAHVVGDEGIVDRLTKRGLTVTPVTE